MHRSTALQFRLMSPEAKRAAVQRLMFCGCPVAAIAAQIGCSVEDVHSLIGMTAAPQSGELTRVSHNWMRASRSSRMAKQLTM